MQIHSLIPCAVVAALSDRPPDIYLNIRWFKIRPSLAGRNQRPVMPRAPKSIDQAEYQVVLDLIRTVRIEAELSQQALGRLLGRPQTYASDSELGVRRLDALQLHQWCVACGTTLTAFSGRLERALAEGAEDLPQPPQRARSKARP